MSVHPFDAVLTSEGIWCFVEPLFWGGPPYSCRPKYVPTPIYNRPFMGHFWQYGDQTYSRLGDAAAVQQIQEQFTHHFDSQGYLLGEAVQQVIPAVSGKEICQHNQHSKTAAATAYLIDILVTGGVPAENIGVTGSVLLDGAVDGFSDLDLVLYGADTIRQAMAVLQSAFANGYKDLYYRNLQEACHFYHKYSVISQLTDEEFAQHFVRKYSQGIIRDVPFTIFTVPDEETALELTATLPQLSPSPSPVTLTGVVLEAKDANYTPVARYLLRDEAQKDVVVYCLDRACVGQAGVGDEVYVEAYPTGHDTYLIQAMQGVIKNLSYGLG